MAQRKLFEFLEHVSDAYIAAYGRTLEEAFENAAVAMFNVMTDTEAILPKNQEQIEVLGEDEYALLYNWLERLLIKFETENSLYSKFKVKSIEQVPRGYRLTAIIWGEPYNPERHPSKTGIKAVTYHQMEIIKQPGYVVVKVLFDI
ncbi:archease [Candidatus Bathyarchaeota archaeon]|nr:archease [Candidatus Bathyarchaeota archaeon]